MPGKAVVCGGCGRAAVTGMHARGSAPACRRPHSLVALPQSHSTVIAWSTLPVKRVMHPSESFCPTCRIVAANVNRLCNTRAVRRNGTLPYRLGILLLALVGQHGNGAERVRGFDDLRSWAIEQMAGGTVQVRNGAIEIQDKAGCTLWWREKLTAPVVITYKVTALSGGEPTYRVSDVNCFWMAQERGSTDAPFVGAHARSGRFAEYDTLLTYYVGYGGNNNTTTRFRRYDGTAARPLRPEHDLAAPRFLLEPNRTYRIRLVARGGRAEFWRDDELIFSFDDPSPLASGWFAIRTVRSHLRIEDLRIE